MRGKNNWYPHMNPTIPYVIVGLGKTGFACAQFLASHNIPFALTDTRAEPPYLLAAQKKWPAAIIKVGELNKVLIESAEVLVVSPGLSLQTPLIATALVRGTKVIGDIELFAQFYPKNSKLAVITGSNAKSTVTALLAEMAKSANCNFAMGGNFGTPALELLQQPPADLYILELSSFQLETTHHLKPDAATILNISEDHMDRYPNFIAYRNAKLRIYREAKAIINNRDDLATAPLDGNVRTTFGLAEPLSEHEYGLRRYNNTLYLARGSRNILSVEQLKLKGRHNWANALAALALGEILGLPLHAMQTALMTFVGLPHRCQWVRQYQQVDFYNDSKATNVGAAIAAIEGIAATINGKIILLAGGQGKGADFSLLKPALRNHAKALIAYGEDGSKIVNQVTDSCQIVRAVDMAASLAVARQMATKGDAVLLAPACASFDGFRNFEHRGEVFMTIVQGWPE